MKKFIYVGMILSLTACGTMQNPYQGMTPQQLTPVKTAELCRVASSSLYQKESSIYIALQNRQINECSNAEIYCKETLGLKFGTPEYAMCRMNYQNYELAAEQVNIARKQAASQTTLNYEASRYLQQKRMYPGISPMSNNRLSTRCTTNYIGGTAYTNCY